MTVARGSSNAPCTQARQKLFAEGDHLTVNVDHRRAVDRVPEHLAQTRPRRRPRYDQNLLPAPRDASTERHVGHHLVIDELVLLGGLDDPIERHDATRAAALSKISRHVGNRCRPHTTRNVVAGEALGDGGVERLRETNRTFELIVADRQRAQSKSSRKRVHLFVCTAALASRVGPNAMDTARA